MTKAEKAKLEEELKALRERIDALEKRPEYHFHYHPPVYYYPPQPLLPWNPYIYQPTTSGIVGASGNALPTSGLPSAPVSINRMETLSWAN